MGEEPPFTNYAEAGGNKFMDTLDYIFLSKNGKSSGGGNSSGSDGSKSQNPSNNVSSECEWQWSIDSVGALPTKAQGIRAGPLPNKREPSDHLLLSAVLRLTAAQQKQ